MMLLLNLHMLPLDMHRLVVLHALYYWTYLCYSCTCTLSGHVHGSNENIVHTMGMHMLIPIVDVNMQFVGMHLHTSCGNTHVVVNMLLVNMSTLLLDVRLLLVDMHTSSRCVHLLVRMCTTSGPAYTTGRHACTPSDHVYTTSQCDHASFRCVYNSEKVHATTKHAYTVGVPWTWM